MILIRFISRELEEFEEVLSKARRLFVADKLQLDDFGQFKKKLEAVFSVRRVSTDQVINLLNRNTIHVNQEQAIIILDFLYLLARTYSSVVKCNAAKECDLTF